jgi:acylphosphatase
MRRIHVRISGKVQGVAFRHDTRRTALSLNLTGWVKNLPDGRVEAVFEGENDSIDAMRAWCSKGPPLAHVLHVDTQEKNYKGEFSDFRILL